MYGPDLEGLGALIVMFAAAFFVAGIVAGLVLTLIF